MFRRRPAARGIDSGHGAGSGWADKSVPVRPQATPGLDAAHDFRDRQPTGHNGDCHLFSLRSTQMLRDARPPNRPKSPTRDTEKRGLSPAPVFAVVLRLPPAAGAGAGTDSSVLLRPEPPGGWNRVVGAGWARAHKSVPFAADGQEHKRDVVKTSGNSRRKQRTYGNNWRSWRNVRVDQHPEAAGQGRTPASRESSTFLLLWHKVLCITKSSQTGGSQESNHGSRQGG